MATKMDAIMASIIMAIIERELAAQEDTASALAARCDSMIEHLPHPVHTPLVRCGYSTTHEALCQSGFDRSTYLS